MNGNSSKLRASPPLPLRGTSPKGGSKGLCEFALVHFKWYSAYRETPPALCAASPFRGGWIRHKNFPQGVWNVETGSVEKFTSKHLETPAVDKLLFLPFVLWIKSPRKSCAFGTFPHKLLLLPLLLPKPIDR